MNEGWTKDGNRFNTASISHLYLIYMARSRNLLLRDLHGKLGDQIVVKQYGKRTVVTKFPDMSNIKPSELQEVKRSSFQEAVAYAQSIIRDPKKKMEYKSRIKQGKSVYPYAIKEYLRNNKGQ